MTRLMALRLLARWALRLAMINPNLAVLDVEE
jgi:hypothetical protein